MGRTATGPAITAGMRRSAVVDPTGRYRHRLARSWGDRGAGHVNWIMLNPSTADDRADDPTTRRCISFARA